MTKCKPGFCDIGQYYEYGCQPSEILWERQMKIDKVSLKDIIKFNYCPECGRKINWKRIKKKFND
jgi:hypothetical protein